MGVKNQCSVYQTLECNVRFTDHAYLRTVIMRVFYNVNAEKTRGIKCNYARKHSANMPNCSFYALNRVMPLRSSLLLVAV